MTTQIIACRTIEKELTEAMARTGTTWEVIWLESGLHSMPKKLHAVLAERLAECTAHRVLLAMGFCGNSLIGLQTGDHELIFPRADDCISLLIGSVRDRIDYSAQNAAFFLTEGWLAGEQNIWTEYLRTVEKYGEKRGRKLAKMMYGHYRTLTLLDNGIDPLETLEEKARVISQTLELEQKVLPATLSYLEQLLTGPWPEDRFIIKAPFTAVTTSDLTLIV